MSDASGVPDAQAADGISNRAAAKMAARTVRNVDMGLPSVMGLCGGLYRIVTNDKTGLVWPAYRLAPALFTGP